MTIIYISMFTGKLQTRNTVSKYSPIQSLVYLYLQSVIAIKLFVHLTIIFEMNYPVTVEAKPWGWAKMSTILQTIFQIHFLVWKLLNFASNSTDNCSLGLNQAYASIGSDHDLATGDRPLSEPMMAQFRCISVSLSLIELWIYLKKNQNSYSMGIIYKMMFNIVCAYTHGTGTALSGWWRHQMETFPVLLALCAGNSPVTGEFPAQRPVTRSFDVFFDLRPNKRVHKQSWGWWFETPSRSLWRHRNGMQYSLNNDGSIVLMCQTLCCWGA